MTGRAWRLASRELVAHRVQSAVVVLAVGLMLGVLVTALAVLRGLEQICLTAAGVDQEMLAAFSSEDYQDTELFTEQWLVYDGWRSFDADFLTPAFWVGLGATLLVAVCIFSYALLGRTQTMARYRTLGASRGQLVAIFGIYLLMLGGLALFMALVATLLLVAVASLAFGLWLEPWPGICAEAFSGGHWLWGWDARMLLVLALPVVATGATLLLNLDQFFDHKLSKRIKEQL